jgi:hypothetical protein
MREEEVDHRLAIIQDNLRRVGAQIHELNLVAEQAGLAHKLDVFYPILDEIRSYISYPDYDSPQYDE